MDGVFITGELYNQFKGVAGLRIANDPPHPAPPDFAQDQASVPGYKRFSAKSPSSSQPDIKINSSIAINVTDLKHKINGLEHQLNEVNKHCQDLACLDTSSRKDCSIFVDTEVGTELGTELASLKEESEISTIHKTSSHETKLLYKTPENQYKKSEDSGGTGKISDDRSSKDTVKSGDMSTGEYALKGRKLKKRKSKSDARPKAANGSQPDLHKYKTQFANDNFISNVETSSYHSLIESRITHDCNNTRSPSRSERKHRHHECAEPTSNYTTKVKKHRDHVRTNSPENMADQESKHRHKTKAQRDIDKDFIAEIIKRQYKPVKLFGKRESGMAHTEFSEPVCRDQEFVVREEILEGSDLCSCCFDERKRHRHQREHQLNQKRSVCDARLYSSKRHMRHRSHRREDASYKYNDVYNDAEQYDLIPVKDKSGPKSRRKMFVDATIPYNYYKEVPPSPRTHRPRLNLKAQHYTDFQDYMVHRNGLKQRNNSPYRQRNYANAVESVESFDMMENYKAKYKSQVNKKGKNEKHVQYDAGINDVPPPLYQNTENISNNDNPLNKTQDSDVSGDKTDKALNEIKDILQSFLQEIKKEATCVSQCDNSEIMTAKTGDKCLNEFRPSSTKLNTSITPESGLCVNGFGMPQTNVPSPYVSPFANPCCYPILPICPMNCMQNGFMLPSPSYTCNCVNDSKNIQPSEKNSSESNDVKTSTETEKLIKEIYKVVAQNPNNDLKRDYKDRKEVNSPKGNTVDKILTSRSAGDSIRHSKHDVEVATHKVRCHSRSCEAFGSRMSSETYYSRTNPTCSDTMLERLSLEATGSNTDTESSSESVNVKKVAKKNKLAKVLRSFGLLKKKKDVIEEVSESESTVEVSVNPKPPFRQEITNYAMHNQEYYHPPTPMHNSPHHSASMDYHHGHGTMPYCHHGCPGHTPRSSSMYDSNEYNRNSRSYRTVSPYRSPRPHPSAPPYPHAYDHHAHNSPPQVPLCLKEIEVKSIGVQSERKLPFLWKFGRKIQEPMSAQRINDTGARNNNFTQTAEQQKSKLLPASKLAKINWKTLQAKVNELDKPESFSYNTQKKLAEGDIKMRNAMLKKLFYKRNPFSPRNLIVRTLLGKDKSSFGDPPMMYRPRMFL